MPLLLALALATEADLLGVQVAAHGDDRRGRRLAKKPEEPASPLTAEQRLLVLDAWQRSGLPARDFAPLVGMSRHTLYAWKKKFESEGPAGLMDKPRGGPQGSRLPDLTKRTILMLKKANPDWGVERITAMLLRGPGLQASPGAVAKTLLRAYRAVSVFPKLTTAATRQESQLAVIGLAT